MLYIAFTTTEGKKYQVTFNTRNLSEDPIFVYMQQYDTETSTWQTIANTTVNTTDDVSLEGIVTNNNALRLYYTSSGTSSFVFSNKISVKSHDVLASYQTVSLASIDQNFDDDYRFGFNGQEKDNEIAGTGNHNTALFWEYDTRLGRRWNLDPVDQISISNYAVNGLNPILMSDPNGDLFGIKGFGSTSEQRKAAREYAEKTGGKVNGLLKKSINVTYRKLVLQPGRTYNDPNTSYGLTYDYVEKKQHFNQDGTLHDDRPKFTPSPAPTLTQKWSGNKDFFSKLSYGIVDDPYVFGQSLFTQHFNNGNVYHIDGSLAVGNDRVKALAGVATDLVPASKYAHSVSLIQRFTAKQVLKKTFSDPNFKLKEVLMENLVNDQSIKHWDKVLQRIGQGGNIYGAVKPEDKK